jgi:mRNA-degrading endonuclease RelE of RelBE toxin-antitoxin system
MTYIPDWMIFIEASSFVRTCEGLLDDEELRQLQISLMLNPESGKVIPASGGLRKLRWRGRGRGKRGGIRVIYYWIQKRERIHLLIAYAKNRQEDLTADQLKILITLIGD